MHQIPSFQSIAVLSVPNSLSNSDEENESLTKIQQVSFWRLESKSFFKYGKINDSTRDHRTREINQYFKILKNYNILFDF